MRIIQQRDFIDKVDATDVQLSQIQSLTQQNDNANTQISSLTEQVSQLNLQIANLSNTNQRLTDLMKEFKSKHFSDYKQYLNFTIPVTGNYHFKVCGAQGSSSSEAFGGFGATIECIAQLQKGDVVEILCGMLRHNHGGGGTFVHLNNILFIVAGGGGRAFNANKGLDASHAMESGTGIGYSPGTNGTAGEGQGSGSGYYDGNNHGNISYLAGNMEGCAGLYGGGGYSGGAGKCNLV